MIESMLSGLFAAKLVFVSDRQSQVSLDAHVPVCPSFAQGRCLCEDFGDLASVISRVDELAAKLISSKLSIGKNGSSTEMVKTYNRPIVETCLTNLRDELDGCVMMEFIETAVAHGGITFDPSELNGDFTLPYWYRLEFPKNTILVYW